MKALKPYIFFEDQYMHLIVVVRSL
ncbi:hypothetical protein [Escherichia sp. E1S7]